MDDRRFDDLTQHLTSLLSRRRLGRALAVLGLGGSVREAPKANAKKKKKKCKSGTTKCGKACVNTKTNPSHCGGCNRRCSGGAGCVDGSCAGACQPPNTLCNGECVDTETDTRFCGSCAIACVAGQVCFAGECEDLCQNDFDCISELNANGLECTSLPGSAVTVCGCRPDPVLPRRPCNGGEPCSTCCSDEECILRTGNEDMICAGIPPNATILGRSCCLPTGAPCGIGCCGNCGANNLCVGRAQGQNCAINQACASGLCGMDFKCT